MKGFGNSTSSYPEVTASFFDSRLQIRFASIPRDWGPGANNLFLSGSARPFDAVDAKFSFTPRLRMDFVAGSLGVFSLKTIDGEEVWPSDSTDVARTLRKYQTNYSAHRIEWDVTSRLRLSASEGVVYRRRLVFGYLNPFSVYYMTIDHKALTLGTWFKIFPTGSTINSRWDFYSIGNELNWGPFGLALGGFSFYNKSIAYYPGSSQNHLYSLSYFRFHGSLRQALRHEFTRAGHIS